MTRFARAKGSKASNEKAPEDGTPWEVMKEQLLRAKELSEDAKKREAAEQQRIENYENFLKEQKVQKRNASWCEFPEEQSKRVKNTVQSEEPQTKKNKHKGVNIDTEKSESVNIHNDQQKPKKKKKKDKHVLQDGPSSKTDGPELECDDASENKKQKNKNKKKQTALATDTADPIHDHNNISADNQTQKKKKNKKKKQKPNATESSQQPESFSEEANANDPNEDNNISSNQQKSNASKKNGHSEANNNDNNDLDNKNKSQINKGNKVKALKKKKEKKLVDGKPVRRKEVNDRSFQLIINGKEVELVRFDGFPIMRKDADRLEELKKNMIKKGIPKSEVQRTMKLERRRAEKALARLKRDVCYNCRKGGHNLSDCPELKSKIPGVEAAEGVCFKCGSTEHRQFECKVQRDKEFRFATCFICKEQGHIARQCPDNPKGLYPNGGGCKLCGDVTHLRKDCPTASNKKEGNSVKLQTLDSTENIEDIGQQTKMSVPGETSKKPKKIKF